MQTRLKNTNGQCAPCLKCQRSALLEFQQHEQPLSDAKSLYPSPPPEGCECVYASQTVICNTKPSIPRRQAAAQRQPTIRRTALAATHPAAYHIKVESPSKTFAGTGLMLPPPIPHLKPLQHVVTPSKTERRPAKTRLPWRLYTDPMRQVSKNVSSFDRRRAVILTADLDTANGNVISPTNMIILPFGGVTEYSNNSYNVEESMS